MPDLKISQLTAGGDAQATDELVVARAGGNNKVTGANIAAAATKVGTLTSLTVSGATSVAAITASGTATLNGNTVLGDATSDTVTVTARVASDVVPSTDNARDLGTSALKWKQVYATTLTEGTAPVVVQTDIGSAPNEIPLNQYLGAMAYVDTPFTTVVGGAGITTGTNTVAQGSFALEGGIRLMRVLIDLRGLNSGGTVGDIIGVNGTALRCYIARIPSMTVLGGRMTCLEAPAGGDTDIDLYSATEDTGVEDQPITDLTETELINAGSQSRGTTTFLSANPAAGTYLYLVGQGTANATYTAGRFLIELFGV